MNKEQKTRDFIAALRRLHLHNKELKKKSKDMTKIARDYHKKLQDVYGSLNSGRYRSMMRKVLKHIKRHIPKELNNELNEPIMKNKVRRAVESL